MLPNVHQQKPTFTTGRNSVWTSTDLLCAQRNRFANVSEKLRTKLSVRVIGDENIDSIFHHRWAFNWFRQAEGHYEQFVAQLR